MTQCDRVLDYLKQNGSISQKEASEDLGCYRLAARIADLKERGIVIRRAIEEGVNRFGQKTRYARYWMVTK